jgi:hypothetical protein
MKSKNKHTYGRGERVEFVRVTMKYACRGGIVKEKIVLYTDDTLKYPNRSESSRFSKDLNIYREDLGNCREITGYIVDAVDAAGRHAETVAVTENFILGSYD